MVRSIHVGCAAAVGHGGLGSHVDFVYGTILRAGHQATVYSRYTGKSSNIVCIASPSWFRFIPYSPLRWNPGQTVYLDSVDFDRTVARQFPSKPIVYHSFPGYAEESFQRVKHADGVTVLEAATVHVRELFAITSNEHAAYQMGGNPFSRPWVDRVLREYQLADYITVSSTLQMDSFMRNGVPKNKLLFSPLGVDLYRFSQDYCGQRDESDKFRIVQVGQVSLLKGFQYLLEALVILNDPAIEVTLFGGVGWRRIRQLIGDYIHRGLHVRVASGDPVEVLRKSHLCVHASLTDGFGMAPLEAMAMSVPTVVTDNTGMKDLIKPGVNGFIVPSKDPYALASQIKQLKQQESLRQRIGNTARRTALEYERSRCQERYRTVLDPIWRSRPLETSFAQ